MKRIIYLALILTCINIVTMSYLFAETGIEMLKRAISTNPTNIIGGESQKQVNWGSSGTVGASLWSDGAMYFGNFEGNKKHNVGSYKAPNGKEISNCPGAIYFVGVWKNDQKASGKCYNDSGNLLYNGVFENDKPTGTYPSTGSYYEKFKYQTLDYTNGDKYIGQTEDGKPKGNGVYAWKSGDLWYGSWENGEAKGYGHYISLDGTLKYNQFDMSYSSSNNPPPPPPPPAIATTSSSMQAGLDMLKRAINTNPSNIWDNGKQKGQWTNGGNISAFIWSSGAMYFGEWQGNKMHGYAINIQPEGYTVNNCPNAKFYVGNWSNDKKSGTGTCYDASGKLIYNGEFSNDKPTGTYPTTDNYSSYKFETINYTSGDKYVGQTKSGERVGYGVYAWNNGDIWIGPWNNGVRAGRGAFIASNGSYTSGVWNGDTHTPDVVASNNNTPSSYSNSSNAWEDFGNALIGIAGAMSSNSGNNNSYNSSGNAGNYNSSSYSNPPAQRQCTRCLGRGYEYEITGGLHSGDNRIVNCTYKDCPVQKASKRPHRHWTCTLCGGSGKI